MSKPWTGERVDNMIAFRSKSKRPTEITRDRIYKYLLEEERMIIKVYGRKLEEKRKYSDTWYEVMDTFIRKILIVRHLQNEFAPPEQGALFPPDEIKSDFEETNYDV